MRWLVLLLVPVAFAVSLPLTWLMMRLGHRLRTFDSAGVPGQIKAPPRRIPNTGGVAIFWGIVLPVLAGLGFIWLFTHGDAALPSFLAPLQSHLPGIRHETPLAILVVGCMAVLHILGLVDDRRPMGPWIKLAIMAGIATVIVGGSDTRLLELFDKRVGGPWLSMAVTILWFLIVTNAMNFMDNMDGLSAGVAAAAGGCFLAGILVQPNPQWFVGACLALLIGACLGFLVFNFPRTGGARIFMGDGGSLVLGFFLAFLTVRTTYTEIRGVSPVPTLEAGGWYGLLMPLVVLAVPLYDTASVVLIRLSQGKSPFVGDTQHLSHRLVNLGLSRRAAVAVILGLTAITGIAGILLSSVGAWQAIVVGIQTALILLVIALFEYARAAAAKPVSPRSDQLGRTLIQAGWGAALTGTLLRALASTDPFPFWDTDPSRLNIPLSGLTPAFSQIVDVAIIAGSGVALIGESLRGRAISLIYTALILIGAAAVVVHALILKGGSLEDARIGSTWIAAMTAALAAIHVCRDERTRRLTIAVCFGLVMMLAAKGILQVTAEHQATVREYRANPDAFAAAQGWLPGSGQVRAFERRLEQPEASGWFGLANIYASFAAAGLIAFTGWVILAARQLITRSISPLWVMALGLGTVLSAIALWLAGSKGGTTAAGIGLALAGRMLLVRRIRILDRLTPRAGGMLAIALILSALAALVLRGIIGERMGELSLLFRWFYIQGASRIFGEHPFLGVGPAGFKDAYMLAKPPISPEEVQSPHSIFFDFASTLGIFGLAWCAAALCWIYNLGKRIVERDDTPAPPADIKAEGWTTAALILIPMLAAARLELAIGTPYSAVMRIAGLAAWLAVSLATLALARRDNAWKWPAAIAGLVLAVHGQIEVTPVWTGSCCLFTIILAAAGADAPRESRKPSSIAAGSTLVILAITWGILAATPTVRWELLLRRAADQVHPIADITTRLSALRDPRSGESLPRITADLGALLHEPAPTDEPSLFRALDRLSAQRSATAADLLTQAAATSHDHFPTVEAASRTRMAQAAALTRLGQPAAAPLDDAATLAQRTAPQGTASAYSLIANTWAARSALEKQPELMDRAVEAWTTAAAMDPYGLTFPLRIFRAELSRGHSEAARRWAKRLLDLDKLQRLDPLKGLSKAERDEVDGALRLP